MNSKLYTRRLAVIDLAGNLFQFGGHASFVNSMLDCCEDLGIWVDIFTDIGLNQRGNHRVAPEIYNAFITHTRFVRLDTSQIIKSRMAKYPAILDGITINAFLHGCTRWNYDLVIYNTTDLAVAGCMTGIKHPNSYIYLHQHELFMDLPGSSIVPDWMQSYLKCAVSLLPITGVLTQCPQNVPRIKESIGVENVDVLPITMPNYTQDYSNYSEREGIAFLGSGEEIKNPEYAIDVFNKVNREMPELIYYFFIGRGKRRLEKMLEKAKFNYLIMYKLPTDTLIDQLKKCKLGIHTANCEGYGISIAEQMHFYPVLLRKDVDYAEHFPSAATFETAQEAADLIIQLQSNKKIWESFCAINKIYLDKLSRDSVKLTYTRLSSVHWHETNTSEKVRDMVVSKPMLYKDVLKALNWQDTISTMAVSPQWMVGFYHTPKHTILAHPEWSQTEVEKWARKAYLL